MPSAVANVLSDERIAKLGVNIAGDANRVVRDFGCAVKGLYDLCKMNKKPGQKLKKSVSLEDIVRSQCPENMHISKSEAIMSKGVRTGNWEAWPLSAEQVEYAAKDAALAVMAFMSGFGMDTKGRELSKEAVEALVELEEVDSENIVKPKAKSAKKAAGKKGAEDEDKENKEDNKDAEEETKGPAKKDHKNFFQAMRNSVLSPPNKGQKDHPQGPSDALSKVCIVVSGILDSFERKDMEEYVKQHGGKTSKTVTNKVTHLVTDHGEAGPSKLAKCKELGIPCVSEDVILQMVKDAQS